MPPAYDIWVSRELARYLYRYPQFGLGIQRLIAHNVLGGLWFAMALFVFWVQSEKAQTQEGIRNRVRATILGSMIAVILTILASLVVRWLPPSENPILTSLYPDYLDRNPNVNSFPSQSTAIYSALSAGIYSLSRKVGLTLWVAVGLLVALPRMYVGGHYLSDVLAGLILGLAGYAMSRYLFEPQVIPNFDQACERNQLLWSLLNVVAFLWILEVAVDFHDIAWLRLWLWRVLRIFWCS